jgi:hypothetical protein
LPNAELEKDDLGGAGDVEVAEVDANGDALPPAEANGEAFEA